MREVWRDFAVLLCAVLAAGVLVQQLPSAAASVMVVFRFQGVGDDAYGVVLTVDGAQYQNASVPISFIWDSSSEHQVCAANPIPGRGGEAYFFVSWINGNGLGSDSCGTYITPYFGQVVIANYGVGGALMIVSISSIPDTGFTFLAIDGTFQAATPVTFSWQEGSTHTLTAISPVGCGTGCQYVWSRWSDGGAQSHAITVNSLNLQYVVIYQKQYYLTVKGGGACGKTTPLSGWYPAGGEVKLATHPANGCTFQSWTGTGVGGYTGTANATAIEIRSPITETAAFATPTPEFPLSLQTATMLILIAAAIAALRRRSCNPRIPARRTQRV